MVKQLLLKLLIFGILVGLVSYAALQINPDYRKEYVVGVVPKLEKLKNTKTKKIVIVGGSNASFGVDTELMEERLGMPVVNMALHGGLPIKFIIEQVKGYLKEGDILILSKEYSGFKDAYWNRMTGVELPKIVTYDISQIKPVLVDRELFESTASGIFKTIKSYIEKYPIKPKNTTTSVYSIKAFNGDNLKSEFIDGHYNKNVEVHPMPKVKESNAPLLLNGLREYNQYFKEKGVEFYLTPPVLIKGYYDRNEIGPFWETLSQKTGIPMLNKGKDYVYDKKYFFNSHYHTNKEGRRLRTESLIHDISRKLNISVKDPSKKIYVGDLDWLNLVDMSMFNKMRNFKILRRDAEGLLVKQSGELEHNYFRIQVKGQDYGGYALYLKLKCTENVLEQLKFRGIGKQEDFDTIMPLANDEYELWKIMGQVFYSDGNSYFGVSLIDDEQSKGSEFTIKDVGVFKELHFQDNIMDEYSISPQENGTLFFKVVSDSKTVNLSSIINDPKDIQVAPNRKYKVVKSEGILKILDFYTGKIISETSQGITFQKTKGNTVEVLLLENNP